MKILAITDIHKDYEAARAAGLIEAPDLVLDCGDHEQLMNLFEDCPHFYIRGNHEPGSIVFNKGDDPLPMYIPNGSVIEFSDQENRVAVLGVDGNYGSKQTILQVNPRILTCLKGIPPHTVDIMLLHESPLNVQKSSREFAFAMQILSEIERLQPKLVLSGHTNSFSESEKNQVKFINLPDMCAGYLLITIEGESLTYERKKACFGTKY